MTMLTRVPPEANVRRPRRALRFNKLGYTRRAQMHARIGSNAYARRQTIPTEYTGRRDASPRRHGYGRKPYCYGLPDRRSSTLENVPDPNKTIVWRGCSRYLNSIRTATARRKSLLGAVSRTAHTGYRLTIAHNLLTRTPEPFGHRFSGDLPGFYSLCRQ